MDAPFVGIDTSKDRLDVYVLGGEAHPGGRHFAVAHDAAGLATLVARLAGLAPKVVTIEATGGYQRLAVAALAAAGLPTAVVNPAQVRAFANALGQRAKSDPIDAAVIARFAAAVKLEAQVLPDAEALAFADLVTRRKQLVEMRSAEHQRRRQAVHSRLKQSSVRVIETLDREIADLERDLDGRIKASPLWRAKDELLRSAPGIGPRVAQRLIADLPELGQVSAKAIAALVGLAPFTRQSGRWRGKSAIAGGRADVRGDLFVAAMVAAKHDPEMKAFRQRLVDAGKPKIVATIAVARKLLTRLNAMLRDNLPWSESGSAAGTTAQADAVA